MEAASVSSSLFHSFSTFCPSHNHIKFSPCSCLFPNTHATDKSSSSSRRVPKHNHKQKSDRSRIRDKLKLASGTKKFINRSKHIAPLLAICALQEANAVLSLLHVVVLLTRPDYSWDMLCEPVRGTKPKSNPTETSQWDRQETLGGERRGLRE